MKKAVEQHRSVPTGEDKAISQRPIGLGRIEPQMVIEEFKGRRRESHRRSGVPAPGGLDRVDSQKADGVFDLFAQFGGAVAGHRFSHLKRYKQGCGLVRMQQSR